MNVSIQLHKRFFGLVSVACFLLLFIPTNKLLAQRAAKIALGSGTTYYSGDVADGFMNNLYRPSINFGVSYYLSPHASFRGEINQAWIGAADSLVSDPIRSQRNLHFRSALTDFSAQIVIDLFKDESIDKSWGTTSHFSPYIFAGIGGFAFRPQGLFQGVWYDLHALGTEGQYFIDSNLEPYSRFQLNIPFGGGIEYRFSKHWGLQLEASYRYTFTDYLDDVSTNFPDQSQFQDPVAAYFANPSGDFDLFAEGSPRGNPELDDAYIFVSLKAVYFFEEVSRFSRCLR